MGKRTSTNKAVIPAPTAASKEQILRTVFPPMVKVDEINRALDALRNSLFQAMGIVRMASNVAMEPGYERAIGDVWTSLDAAHEILSRIVDRTQSAKNLLADEKEVPRGEY